MKKLLILALFAASSLFGQTDKLEVKTGFLTSKECIKIGAFKDCGLENYKKESMVLYVHDENRYYSFAIDNKLGMSAFDKATNRNEVQLFGKVDHDSRQFVVSKLTAPEAVAVEFFKGCL